GWLLGGSGRRPARAGAGAPRSRAPDRRSRAPPPAWLRRPERRARRARPGARGAVRRPRRCAGVRRTDRAPAASAAEASSSAFGSQSWLPGALVHAAERATGRVGVVREGRLPRDRDRRAACDRRALGDGLRRGVAGEVVLEDRPIEVRLFG